MEEIGFDESCERTWTCEGEELGVAGRGRGAAREMKGGFSSSLCFLTQGIHCSRNFTRSLQSKNFFWNFCIF